MPAIAPPSNRTPLLTAFGGDMPDFHIEIGGCNVEVVIKNTADEKGAFINVLGDDTSAVANVRGIILDQLDPKSSTPVRQSPDLPISGHADVNDDTIYVRMNEAKFLDKADPVAAFLKSIKRSLENAKTVAASPSPEPDVIRQSGYFVTKIVSQTPAKPVAKSFPRVDTSELVSTIANLQAMLLPEFKGDTLYSDSPMTVELVLKGSKSFLSLVADGVAGFSESAAQSTIGHLNRVITMIQESSADESAEKLLADHLKSELDKAIKSQGRARP